MSVAESVNKLLADKDAQITTLRARLATARNDALEEVLRLVQKRGECWYEGGGAESDTGAWNCPKEQKGECLCCEWGDLAEAIRVLKTPAPVAGDGGADDLR